MVQHSEFIRYPFTTQTKGWGWVVILCTVLRAFYKHPLSPSYPSCNWWGIDKQLSYLGTCMHDSELNLFLFRSPCMIVYRGVKMCSIDHDTGWFNFNVIDFMEKWQFSIDIIASCICIENIISTRFVIISITIAPESCIEPLILNISNQWYWKLSYHKSSYRLRPQTVESGASPNHIELLILKISDLLTESSLQVSNSKLNQIKLHLYEMCWVSESQLFGL